MVNGGFSVCKFNEKVCSIEKVNSTPKGRAETVELTVAKSVKQRRFQRGNQSYQKENGENS